MVNKQLSDKITSSVAKELQRELKRVCPVDTGALRNSIKVTYDGDDFVISMLYYWVYVEYLSNPFVRMTLNTKLPDILKRITKELSN